MSYTQFPNGMISCYACISAMDLIRIANQMYNDKMAYAQIRVTFNPNTEDYDGIVRLSAIPSASSDDVTIYPDIEGKLTIEIDDEEDDYYE